MCAIALPGEQVVARVLKRRRGVRYADGVEVEAPSAHRVTSTCTAFPRCGGCAMHHLSHPQQMLTKQRQLQTALAEHGVTASSWLQPQTSVKLGYRRKARLGVRKVGEHVLVGFRESYSNRVARLEECMVLTPELSRLIRPLRDLIGKLSNPAQIPQVEFAQGESASGDDVAIFIRHLSPFDEGDLELWADFERQHGVRLLLQGSGYDSLQSLSGAPAQRLSYRISSFGLHMQFFPTQFTQVNFAMNNILVEQAMAYLGNIQGKTVADLFCGIGNFTLPLARRGAFVSGFELGADAIAMAWENAGHNGLTERVKFSVADLYGKEFAPPSSLNTPIENDAVEGPNILDFCAADAWLLDPPRSGAGPNLAGWLGHFVGHQIVYVSCNPESFAQDAAIIVNSGFTLEQVAVYDMFPPHRACRNNGLFCEKW